MIRLAAVALLAAAAPLQAKDSLGVFGDWGAFRDELRNGAGPRCYAIAMNPMPRSRPGRAARSVVRSISACRAIFAMQPQLR